MGYKIRYSQLKDIEMEGTTKEQLFHKLQQVKKGESDSHFTVTKNYCIQLIMSASITEMFYIPSNITEYNTSVTKLSWVL